MRSFLKFERGDRKEISKGRKLPVECRNLCLEHSHDSRRFEEIQTETCRRYEKNSAVVMVSLTYINHFYPTTVRFKEKLDNLCIPIVV